MYCPNCGCTNNDNATVCDNCGAQIENAIPNALVSDPKPLNNKKIIIILAIVLIIVSIAAAGIIGIVVHKKSNNNYVDYPDIEEISTAEDMANYDETNSTAEITANTTTKGSSTTKENANRKDSTTDKNRTKISTTTKKSTTTATTSSTTKKKSTTTTKKTTHTEYRYRDKTYKTSSNSSMSGWTLYDTTYYWSSYGSWSNWSTNSYSASNSRQVESRTTYRYCAFVCTKCGNRDPYSTPCDNCKTSQYFKWEELWYPTKGNSMSKNTLSTVPDKYYVSINGARWWFERDGYSDGQGGTGQPSRKEYRYRDRKQVATYHFYKWSNWSDWSTTPVSSSDTREVETRKVN